jgi:hypothetical protein
VTDGRLPETVKKWAHVEKKYKMKTKKQRRHSEDLGICDFHQKMASVIVNQIYPYKLFYFFC